MKFPADTSRPPFPFFSSQNPSTLSVPALFFLHVEPVDKNNDKKRTRDFLSTPLDHCRQSRVAPLPSCQQPVPAQLFSTYLLVFPFFFVFHSLLSPLTFYRRSSTPPSPPFPSTQTTLRVRFETWNSHSYFALYAA